MNKNIISNCCKALMRIVGGDEGTNYYECTQCNKACDIYVGDENEAMKAKQTMSKCKCHCHHKGMEDVHGPCHCTTRVCGHCSQIAPRKGWDLQLNELFSELGLLEPYGRLDNKNYVTSYEKTTLIIKEALSSQKQELLNKFEGIIGEDEKKVESLFDDGKPPFILSNDNKPRNDLRAEQRKALEALKGEK